MEVGATSTPVLTPARIEQVSGALGAVERRLDPAYEVAKVARIALGDAPISLGTMAVTGALGMAMPKPAPQQASAISHAGLAADGLLRGLFYSGGLLHGAAAAKLPWLVTSKVAPDGFAGIAAGLSKFASVARIGLLGIGGTLGALRAARAVLDAGGDTRALLDTRDGRGGMLQAVGSALLIVKHPVTYLAGAAMFAAAIVNDFT